MNHSISNIYHYTTLEAFKNIIENKSLRFSDSRFLNDSSELKYGISCVKNFLKRVNKASANSEIINQWKENLEMAENRQLEYHKFKEKENGKLKSVQEIGNNAIFYIISLSEHSDDKDLWTLYGNKEKGLRINFNSSSLFKFLDESLGNFSLANEYKANIFYCNSIKYGRQEGKKYIETEFNDNLKERTFINLKRIYEMIFSMKDRPFSNEKEWRMGITIMNEMINNTEFVESNYNIKKDFFIRDNHYVPCVDVTNIPFEKIIEDVMVSPYNKDELTKLGLEEFLLENKLENVKILHSKIHIR